MSSDSSIVTCPACQASLPVPTEHLGKPIRCGQCNKVFDTPAPKPVPAPVVQDDDPFAIPSPASRDDSDDDDERPRRRSKPADEKKGLGTPVIIAAAVAGLLVVGGAAFGIRYALKDKEPVKTAEATNKPKETPKSKEKEKEKPKELEFPGPGVLMTDEVRERVKASTVYIRTIYGNKLGMGTGFFAGGPGLVVTNAHVVGEKDKTPEKVTRIEVVLNSGLPDERRFPARLLKADPELDLALLKVEIPNNAPPLLEVVDAFKVKETMPVYIFGFPGGETIGTNISVNPSYVSSVRRDSAVPSWIQIAGGMSKGNSGGPVTDAYGRVFGVAVAIIKDTPINMAIPGDSVHSFFNNAAEFMPKKGSP